MHYTILIFYCRQAVTDQVIYPKQVESNSLTMKPQRDCFVVSPDNRPLLSKKLGRKTFTLGSSPPNLNSSQSLTTKTDANGKNQFLGYKGIESVIKNLS